MNNERTLIGQILTDNKIFHSLEITEDDILNPGNKLYITKFYLLKYKGT